MAAWMWLEKELFVIPQPGQAHDWAVVTPRGRRVLEAQDFESYRKEAALRSDNLDPILVRKVKPAFLRGDYDSAVFEAFKEVEVRVRKKAALPDSEIGVSLMRTAFRPQTGPLTDRTAEAGEQQATMDLFAGAVGKFKNPFSHRDITFAPEEVADIIGIANQLLKIVDRS
jgi:uncharacterized protein (TIGR02391 family)